MSVASSANRWTARAVALGHGYRAAAALAETDACQRFSNRYPVPGWACTHRRLLRRSPHVSPASSQVVFPGTEAAFLAPLPVGLLPGVGIRTLETLRAVGITTIGQLQMLSASALVHVCGNRGRTIARLALGLDGGSTPIEAETITARWLAAEPEADARRLRAHLHSLTAASRPRATYARSCCRRPRPSGSSGQMAAIVSGASAIQHDVISIRASAS